MAERVITYWHGPKKPAWISLCLETAQRHIPGLEIHSAWSWKRMYDGRFGPFRRILRQRPNVQSDILRAWFLMTHGGIWMDADCIVFRDVRPIMEHLNDAKHLVAYRVHRLGICSALIAAKAGTPIVARYCKLLDERMKRTPKLPPYAAGPKMLSAACGDKKNVHMIPHELVHPMPLWLGRNRQHRIAIGKTDVYEFHPDAYTFMLTHSAPRHGDIRGLSREAILGHPGVIAQAFRKALGS